MLSMLLYVSVQIYPVYLIITDNTYLKFDRSSQIKAVIVIALHSILLGLSLSCR
jgi:c-di-AMP phosphodiesterase-like protein